MSWEDIIIEWVPQLWGLAIDCISVQLQKNKKGQKDEENITKVSENEKRVSQEEK